MFGNAKLERRIKELECLVHSLENRLGFLEERHSVTVSSLNHKLDEATTWYAVEPGPAMMTSLSGMTGVPIKDVVVALLNKMRLVVFYRPRDIEIREVDLEEDS